MALRDNPRLVWSVVAIVVIVVLATILMSRADDTGETEHQRRVREAAQEALEAGE